MHGKSSPASGKDLQNHHTSKHLFDPKTSSPNIEPDVKNKRMLMHKTQTLHLYLPTPHCLSEKPKKSLNTLRLISISGIGRIRQSGQRSMTLTPEYQTSAEKS